MLSWNFFRPITLVRAPTFLVIYILNIEIIILKNCVKFLYSDRYQYHVTAFSLVIVHDFLDHVDGIVAKAHRQMFGQIDDPLLGGFMDAFCDKVINL